MVATIVLNQSNLIANGQNNTFIYKFPNSVAFPNHEIAVQSITMYYSWSNVNQSPLGNTKFTYSWTSGTTTTVYNVNIPDGQYEIADINSYLQFVMIQNGTYLINSSGSYVYYAEMIVNPTLYSVQVNTFPVPTSLPSGWSTPVANPATGGAGFAGFPTTTQNPVLTFPANFNQIIGFPGNYSTSANVGAGTNLAYTSAQFRLAPQVQPNSSIYFSISNISNKYAIPNSIIYSLSPNVAFGEQISTLPPQFAWNKLLSGTYNELRLTILGLDQAPLKILDPNMTIVLVIRDTKDMGGLSELLTKATGGK
jgi:hypothetical protein